MNSSDSDAYFTATEKMQMYLRHPDSRHGQSSDADDEASPVVETFPTPEQTVQLDANDPVDYGECPIPRDKWGEVPLSPRNSAIISIRIKRVSFIRQEQWKLEDHLFRYA